MYLLSLGKAMSATVSLACTFTAVHAAPLANSSIWVNAVPNYVRPYAIQHYSAGGCIVGQQVYRFPVTGPSSGNAFTLISTNAPQSSALGVLPHTHKTHWENFFNYKGRFQLWAEKDGIEETRILNPGDYGGVPHNTKHTFQILDPDTEMIGVIQPGGFENLFYALASSNYTSPTYSPYDPSIQSTNSSPPPEVIESLQTFDVWAELEYQPRQDAIDGFAPANATWRNGNNTLANDETTPYFLAKDFGPKYLNSQGSYQIIEPLVTPTQSAGNFTLSTITISRHASNTTAQHLSFPRHAAFEVLEGLLKVFMEGEQLDLLQGDVVFIPGNTTYQYYSGATFTKFLHVSQGNSGLDTTLILESKLWNSPVWPTS